MVIRLHSIQLQHSMEDKGVGQEAQGAGANEVSQVKSKSLLLRT
jgi:hypothetical protein